jgi:hypothetical protein
MRSTVRGWIGIGVGFIDPDQFLGKGDIKANECQYFMPMGTIGISIAIARITVMMEGIIVCLTGFRVYLNSVMS